MNLGVVTLLFQHFVADLGAPLALLAGDLSHNRGKPLSVALAFPIKAFLYTVK
jgi:hypothetical protein